MAVLEASYIHRAFIRHELMRGCVCVGGGGGAVRLSGCQVLFLWGVLQSL